MPVYHHRSRPQRPRPETDESEPNKTWRCDIVELPTLAGTYHLVPVLAACSRKISGRYFGLRADLGRRAGGMGQGARRRGPVGRGRAEAARGSVRPRRPDVEVDQAVLLRPWHRAELLATTHSDRQRRCEAWIATIKCERLYDADTADMTPDEVESVIDRFIDFHNNERLHQAFDYVTPAERHDGRPIAIIEAERRGMQEAKLRRRIDAYGGRSGETDA